jgi:hypothetical protein
MPDLRDFERLTGLENGLAVVTTLRRDQTMQASVVNAGTLGHPVTGDPVVGFVAMGGSHKLANLRLHRRATVVLRAGWEWVAVEGPVELFGPDDVHPELDDDGIRELLRSIFAAAGGTHDDWDEYDAVMADQRRTAVLISPQRIYSNRSQ